MQRWNALDQYLRHTINIFRLFTWTLGILHERYIEIKCHFFTDILVSVVFKHIRWCYSRHLSGGSVTNSKSSTYTRHTRIKWRTRKKNSFEIIPLEMNFEIGWNSFFCKALTLWTWEKKLTLKLKFPRWDLLQFVPVNFIGILFVSGRAPSRSFEQSAWRNKEIGW